jgi:general secretion pathway protein D
MTMHATTSTTPAHRRRARPAPAALAPRWAVSLAIAAFALPAGLHAQAPRAPAAADAENETRRATASAATAATSGVRSRAPVTVNFVNAEIEAVARAFAAMIERPIVVDPRVVGQITVYSERPQSIRDAYFSFLSALRGKGFAVVENNGLLRVVPEPEAKLVTGTVSVGEVGVRGDQVITQIFQLRYENPNNLVAVLRPLISANNTINANPASGSLVITDYADNLQRLAKIVAALDQPSSTEVEVIPLVHVVAADIAPLVQRFADGGGTAVGPAQAAAAAGSGATSVIADSRGNALIVRAPNTARLAAIKATIAKLDRPSATSGPGGGLWVVHLKNADAVRLASVLRAAFGTAAGSGGAGVPGGTPATTQGLLGAAGAPGAAPGAAAGATQSIQATSPVQAAGAVTTGGFIQADPASNSLIITAPEPLYRQVRAMIEQLDTRRAQVYIESMIVEVAGDNAADFGFQWQGLSGQRGDSWGVLGGTNFTPAGGSGNIIGVQQGALGSPPTLAVGEGLNLALLRNYNGVYALAAIARFLQSQANTNIVSTPNLITLDNEEAKIVVGENVPFITGQFTNTGTGSANPFQTIERKDVGITLRIRPQIGEGGAIRMQIFQEQSSVKETTAAGTTNAGPSTTKRSIESNVVVDDGQIIVLGGLIEDRFVENKSKVPLLGDLPVVGGLFRSESRERRRTNLMVFLRPIVMRDADAANRFSTDRYDAIRARQQEVQPERNPLLPVGPAPVIPERPGDSAAPLAPPAPPVRPAPPAPEPQLP